MAWSDASYNWYSASSDYSDVLTNDWRQCQLDGCRKKHAFARGIRGNKVYSKYCAEHTCARLYTEVEGFHCSTPRKADERYCPDHLRCNEPGCDRQGEFVGVHDYVPWVCVSHRCTAPDCRSRATDPNQQRCAAHFNRCTVAGCSKPCYLHRDGRLDLVCAVHYGTIRCLWDGCARRTGSSMRYCPAHRCTIPNCTAKRGAGDDAEACYKHRCAIPSCPHPVLDPALPFASLYCAEHACCAKGCPALRASANTDFCTLHACPTLGCRSPARAAGAHCVRHACEVVTCKRERLGELAGVNVMLSGGGQHPERCAEHSYARERRRASLAGAGRGIGIATGVGGLDVEWLKERFGAPDEEMWEEQRRKAKRWSDDLAGVRSREEEREWEREEELQRKRAELRELRSEMRQQRMREDKWGRS